MAASTAFLPAVNVVARFFRRIGKDLVGFVDLLHARRRASGIRVVLSGKSSVGSLYHLGLGAETNTKDIVVVFPVELVLFHG